VIYLYRRVYRSGSLSRSGDQERLLERLAIGGKFSTGSFRIIRNGIAAVVRRNLENQNQGSGPGCLAGTAGNY